MTLMMMTFPYDSYASYDSFLFYRIFYPEFQFLFAAA
jgi:hypothetical protein